MKFCALLVIACACAKPDDVRVLRDESHATVAYYQGELDELDTRLQSIVRRGLKIDRPLPESDVVGPLVVKASNDLRALHAELADEAHDLATAGTARELAARIDEYRDTAETGIKPKDRPPIPGVQAIGAVLTMAESWLAQAEVEMARAGSAAAR